MKYRIIAKLKSGKDASYMFDGCKTDEIQGIEKLINNLNKLDLYL